MGTTCSQGLKEKPNHWNKNLKRLSELCRVVAAESKIIDSLYESALNEGRTSKKLRKPSWFRGKFHQLDYKEVSNELKGSSKVKAVNNSRHQLRCCTNITNQHQRLTNRDYCKKRNFRPEILEVEKTEDSANVSKSAGAEVSNSLTKSSENVCVYERGHAEATCSINGRKDLSKTKLQRKSAVNEADVDLCAVKETYVQPCASTRKQSFSACGISMLSAYMVATFSSFDAVYLKVCDESKETCELRHPNLKHGGLKLSQDLNVKHGGLELSQDLNVLQPERGSGAQSVFCENLNLVPWCSSPGNPVTDWVSRPEELLVLQSEVMADHSRDDCLPKPEETSQVTRTSIDVSSDRNRCFKDKEPQSARSKNSCTQQLPGAKRGRESKLPIKECGKKKPLRSVRLRMKASAVLCQHNNKKAVNTQRTPEVVRKRYYTEGGKSMKSRTATCVTSSRKKSKAVQKRKTWPRHAKKTKYYGPQSVPFMGDRVGKRENRPNHDLVNPSKRSKISNVSRTKAKKRQIEQTLEAAESKKRCVRNECSTKEDTILHHHKRLCAPASSSSPFCSLMASQDMFAQLCQLDEKSKQYDSTMLYSLMPWTQKTSRSLYKRTSQSLKEQEFQRVSHVGGVWKSIFSEN